MEHLLDNPAWNALISGNKDLAYGNEQVRYFDRQVSPFVAFEKNTPENFRALHDLIPHNNPVLFVTPVEVVIPQPWKILHCVKGIQMIYDGVKNQDKLTSELIPLTKQHVPQMMALTKLTNPGPFESHTINFGHYYGIFESDKLVAMAGQRLHVFNYAEISAVCTHPEYLGKGYARQLLQHQLGRIITEGNTPFLHVRYDNERAIKVYESLGFSARREVYFYVMRKSSDN